MTDPQGPEFLNYRSRKDEPPGNGVNILLMGFGLVLGAGATVLAGAVIFLGSGITIAPATAQAPGHPLQSILFLCLVVASVFGIAKALRAPRRHWFAAGLLLGMGLMSLMEGLCFAFPNG